MRYRIKNYTTDGQTVMLNDVTLNSIEDLRLVINLTQGIVIYSPMDRSGIEAVMERGFVVETNVCTLNEKTPDQLLIEIDKGEKLGSAGIDTTELAKEQTLIDKAEEIKQAVENAKPEIDTTELAKQGDNPNATLTAIYKLLTGSEPDTPEIIPEGVAERLALILEFFGIKPIQAYEFMTAEEVCYELEEIMTTMDINLTPEKAKEITQQTLNN